MFTFIGERYYNDYTRISFKKTFYSLDEFFEWAKKVSNNFTDIYDNWFPTFRGNDITRITIKDTENCDWCFFIYQINNEKGIVFSTGKFTNGKKFCAQKIKEWCTECSKRMKEIRENPNFVEC